MTSSKGQSNQPEPMETEVTPASPTADMTEIAPIPTAKVCITRQDLVEFPVLRAPIKGKEVVIPDRDLSPPEIEDRTLQKVSARRRKGTTGPSWGNMEPFTSTPPPRN